MRGMSRWVRLGLAVMALLLAGIIYAWSFLKQPLADLYGWDAQGSQLQLNYTLTLCFFCLGGVLSGLLEGRVCPKIRMVLGAAFVTAGFGIVSRLTAESSPLWLYFGYGFLAGLGIGIVYNVVIAVTNAWFPDRKGIASGSMMVGFGFSAMVLGNLAVRLYAIPGFGWQGTFLWYGIGIGALLALMGLIIRLPEPGEVPAGAAQASGDGVDYSTRAMLARPSFWLLFLLCTLIGMVGSTAIAQSRQFVMGLDPSATALAALGASMVSVMNGAGRLVVGAMFDKLGMRKTQYANSLALVLAPLVMLSSLWLGSPVIAVAGLCLCGFLYSFAPTVTATFSLAFYGRKHFSLNFPVLTMTLIPASFAPTLAGSLGYETTYLLLTGLAILGAILNLAIKKA